KTGEVLVSSAQGLLRYTSSGALAESLEVEHPVRALAFDPTGASLALWDGRALTVLRATTGECVFTRPLEGRRGRLEWSPDGGLLHALASGHQLLTVTKHGEVLARSRSCGLRGDILAARDGVLLMCATGHHALALDGRTHDLIARGPRVGARACVLASGDHPAVCWTSRDGAFFIQEWSVDERRFARDRAHGRVWGGEDKERAIQICDVVGSSPDGRWVFTSSSPSHKPGTSLAILDRALERHVGVVHFEQPVRRVERASCDALRRALLVHTDAGLFAVHLDELSADTSRSSWRPGAPAHPFSPGLEAGGALEHDGALTSAQHARVSAWREEAEGRDLAPRGRWSMWDMHKTQPSPERAERTLLDDVLDRATHPEELMSLLPQLTREERAQLFAQAHERSNAHLELCRAVLCRDVRRQLKRAIDVLETMGERVITPWVHTATHAVEPDVCAPFEEGWRLGQAFRVLDLETSELQDKTLHSREMLEAVLAWASAPSIHELTELFARRMERWPEGELALPLHMTELEAPWSFDVERLQVFEGDRVSVAALLDLERRTRDLDQVDELLALATRHTRHLILSAFDLYHPLLDFMECALELFGDDAAQALAEFALLHGEDAVRAALKELNARDAPSWIIQEIVCALNLVTRTR
ncbi:MAG: hypothetical protein AAGI01_16220, partial [Myxococcota bacterium]